MFGRPESGVFRPRFATAELASVQRCFGPNTARPGQARPGRRRVFSGIFWSSKHDSAGASPAVVDENLISKLAHRPCVGHAWATNNQAAAGRPSSNAFFVRSQSSTSARSVSKGPRSRFLKLRFSSTTMGLARLAPVESCLKTRKPLRTRFFAPAGLAPVERCLARNSARRRQAPPWR